MACGPTPIPHFHWCPSCPSSPRPRPEWAGHTPLPAGALQTGTPAALKQAPRPRWEPRASAKWRWSYSSFFSEALAESEMTRGLHGQRFSVTAGAQCWTATTSVVQSCHPGGEEANSPPTRRLPRATPLPLSQSSATCQARVFQLFK